MIETQTNHPVKRLFPSTDTGSLLSYDDIRYMHLLRAIDRRSDRWTPPFVWSPEKFKRVLLCRAWRYAHATKPWPECIDMAAVNKAATERALRGPKIGEDAAEEQRVWAATHIDAIRRAGSFMALESAICFKCWRLGSDSVTVAGEVGLTPGAVRQHLNRTLRIARELDFDCGQPHPTRGKLQKSTFKKMSEFLTVRGIPFDPVKLEAQCKGQ
jgi:hypothetical protein